MFRWGIVLIAALALASLMRSTFELSSLAAPIAALLDTVDAIAALSLDWLKPHMLAVGDWLRSRVSDTFYLGEHWRSVLLVFIALGIVQAEVLLTYGFSEVNAGDDEPRTGRPGDRLLSASLSIVLRGMIAVLACFLGTIEPLGILAFWLFASTVSSFVYFQSTKRYAEQNDLVLRDVLLRDGWWREYFATLTAALLGSTLVAIGFFGRAALG